MNGIAAYNRTRIESAPQEQLLVMLLEKALEKERAARAAKLAGDRVRWQAALHHARAVFIELNNVLDHTEAPEITRQLSITWTWCTHQLMAVAKSGDLTVLDKVEEVTRMMHTTWLQALELRDAEREAS